MGIFDRFPYSSTHEMNLDFMLGKATEIAEDMQTVATGMAQVQAGLSAISEKTEQATQAAAQAAASASSIEGSVTAAEEAAEEAQMHNESAQTWANNALTYKADCQRAATEAAASSSSAAQAATAAAASEDTVAQYAQAANASAQSAANNNDSAHQYANQASASASNATFHSSNAQTAATNAQTAATNANTSATNASASADRAASLKSDVETLHRMCVAAVDQASTEAVNAANSAAQAAATKTDVETLVESLPEDFTDLNNTVNQLSDEIDADRNALKDKTNIINDYVVEWESGYRNTQSDGFDINTIIENENYVTIKIPAKPGDVFYISGRALGETRLLASAASDGTRISTSQQNILWINHKYTCPANTAYIVVNSITSVLYDVYITQIGTIKKMISSTTVFTPRNTPNIVLLGDSITQGVGSSDYAATGEDLPTTVHPTKRNVGVKCWGNMLVNMLNADYTANAVNNGIPQFTVTDLINNLNLLCPTGTNAAILMIGTNNRGSSYSSLNTEFRNLITQILNKGILLYVFSPMPVNGATASTGMGNLNNLMKKACYELGVPFYSIYSNFLSYIDMHDIPIGNCFSDSLHPNDLGYKIMYNLIRKALQV